MRRLVEAVVVVSFIALILGIAVFLAVLGRWGRGR